MRRSRISSGRVLFGKNCCGTNFMPASASAERSHRRADDQPALLEREVDPAAQLAIEGRAVRIAAVVVLAEILGQHLHREVRREHSRDDPREHHRDADDPEDAARVFGGGRLREADRHEAGGRDRARRTGAASRSRSTRRRRPSRGPSPPSIFTTIISMAMIASSTSRPSAMISEPSEMRSRFQPIASITIATHAEHERHGETRR